MAWRESDMTAPDLPRVLVVDDQVSARRVAELVMKTLPCYVDTAMHSEQALQRFHHRDYDLVFMDLGLPEMDGFALCQAFRDIDRQRDRHTPVVALTAQTDEKTHLRYIESSMEDYLVKPLTTDIARRIMTTYIPHFEKRTGQW